MAHRTPEEKIELAIRICETYKSGQYTIDSVCEEHGITVRTFNDWEKESSEISEAYKLAKQSHYLVQKGKLRQLAMGSLLKKVAGFTEDEIHQEVVPLHDAEGNEIGTKNVKIKRVKKYYPPDTMAIMFALNATDPETFKHNQPPQESGEQVFMIGDKPIKF